VEFGIFCVNSNLCTCLRSSQPFRQGGESRIGMIRLVWELSWYRASSMLVDTASGETDLSYY